MKNDNQENRQILLEGFYIFSFTNEIMFENIKYMLKGISLFKTYYDFFH